MSDAQLPLAFLIGAAACFYIGTHLLWRGFGGHGPRRPMLRGMVLALPIGVMALLMPFLDRAGMGVSIVMGGSMLLLTLALGVSAMSCPSPAGFSSPSLRLLVPLCAATFVIGLAGELSILHAASLVGMTLVLLWSDAGTPSPISAPVRPGLLVSAGVLSACGTVALALAVTGLLKIPIVPLLGPVIVPLCLLAAIGLLVGDVHADAGEPATRSIVGAILFLLGFALPAVILTTHLLAFKRPPEPEFFKGSVIVMPLASWRLDSVLLTVVSVLLLPAGMGRMSLGRLEGVFLVAVCIFYMIAMVSVVRA